MAISPDGDPQSRHHRKRQWKEGQDMGDWGWQMGGMVAPDEELIDVRAVPMLLMKCNSNIR